MQNFFYTYKYIYMFLKQEKPEMDDLERRRKTLVQKEKYLILFDSCITSYLKYAITEIKVNLQNIKLRILSSNAETVIPHKYLNDPWIYVYFKKQHLGIG